MTGTGKVNRLMTQYPELKEVKLNEHQLIEYTATDGTKIEGYLTLPNNIEKPAATILYPPGLLCERVPEGPRFNC